MINHARTLLLNTYSANRPAIGMYGEEYIPPEFIPKRLSAGLTRLLNNLFGSARDPLYQNYRASQYMSLLHANGYSDEYIRSLDSRITYEEYNVALFQLIYGITTNQVVPSDMELRVYGFPETNTVVGRSLYDLHVEVDPGNSLVKVRDKLAYKTEFVTITLVGDLTETFYLSCLGSPMQAGIAASSLTAGSWNVLGIASPDEDVTTAFNKAIEAIDQETFKRVFSYDDGTFYGLWRKGISLVDKAGGFLAALVQTLENA